MLNPVFNYLKEVKSELKQTTWPSKDQTKHMTALVVAIATMLAIYLGLLDFLLQKLMSFLI
jgi:preprotein translocase SecE subunit